MAKVLDQKILERRRWVKNRVETRIENIPQFVAELHKQQTMPSKKRTCGKCIFNELHDDFDRVEEFCVAKWYGLQGNDRFDPEECPLFIEDEPISDDRLYDRYVLGILEREIRLRELEIIKKLLTDKSLDQVVDFVYNLIYSSQIKAKKIFEQIQLFFKTGKFS